MGEASDQPVVLDYSTPTATCYKCGVTTIVPGLMVKRAKSFYLGSSRNNRICPRCAAREAVLSNGLMFWFAVIFFIAYLSLWICGKVGGWRMENEPPILGFVVGYVAFQSLIVVVLACWHVIVAWLIGLRVFSVALGVGPRIVRWRLGDFTLDIIRS